eukprot:TRINITY_DN7577_c0_g1_i3.p3 TRINITY_DN7577_c0_g1~~TRINITY_DN7577_c0_g1_i3.p3  ORF type:complete len:136 (+),score=3.76 TRINITY_DN7577_c0_g1_i3:712-1119(+)
MAAAGLPPLCRRTNGAEVPGCLSLRFRRAPSRRLRGAPRSGARRSGPPFLARLSLFYYAAASQHAPRPTPQGTLAAGAELGMLAALIPTRSQPTSARTQPHPSRRHADRRVATAQHSASEKEQNPANSRRQSTAE